MKKKPNKMQDVHRENNKPLLNDLNNPKNPQRTGQH